MFRPRSLSARLFAATAVVACVALVVGIWLVRRAVHYQLDERVVVTGAVPDGAGGTRDVKQEVVREIVARPDRADPLQTLDRRLLVALALVLAGSAVATAVIVRRVVGPVGKLRDAADAVARGQLSARVPVEGAEEIAALSSAFNLMASRLEEQERLKRDLTNDVAHELRTPITNLRCHLEALTDGVVPVTPEALTTIADDVRHLERLVDDLGVLAQADARQLHLAPEAVAIAPAFEHLCRVMGPRAAAARLTIASDAQDGIPPIWIDRDRLVQVVTNLLNNAILHTAPGGSLTLRATRAADAVQVDVIDTGEGIAPEHLPYVFDRFYRADPSRSRKTGGAGLGLAIARQIVTASGGRIAVASEPGRGTTFSLWLPIAAARS